MTHKFIETEIVINKREKNDRKTMLKNVKRIHFKRSP